MKFEKKQKERFVVWVSVTPYVRRYLLDNYHVQDSHYADLVDIRRDPALSVLFTPRLVKHSYRRERQLSGQANSRRSCRVPLLISHEQFTRHGWALSLTDEASLCRALELRCKTILLTYISSLYYVYGNLAQCIELFYRRFHYDDDIWPVDSIRKIWMRDRRTAKKSLKNDFSAKIDEIVLANLSKNGTISHQGIKTYEDH